MMSKIFIDTNILIYSVDNYDKKKQKKCRELLKKIALNANGVISTQVLQEFFVISTKKLNIEPLIAKEIMHSFENFEVINVSFEIIKDAIDCSVINCLSFWDSLILTTAEYSKCTQLLTEDLNHGQIIRNVRIINPISEGKHSNY